jgi:putative flippase GtrA
MTTNMLDHTQVKLTKKQNFIQFLKFTGLSISAGASQRGSFTLFNELAHMRYWPAYLIALSMSVLYNYTLNRRFTFKSTTNLPIAMLKVAGYYAIFTPLSTWWGDALTNIGWNEYIVLVGTMLINFVSEFLFARFVVFRNSINSNAAGQKELARNLQEEQE